MGGKNKLSAGERLTARLLEIAPWLGFFLTALPVPLYFFWRYLTETQDTAVYMLLVLSSLAIGSIAGLAVALFLFMYRKRWLRKMRDRMAADGITADELQWFTSELTPAERKALKGIEGHDPLLADAYRETLASRLTATRVEAKAKRELLLVERRLNRASYVGGAAASSAGLRQELEADRVRLEGIRLEGSERRAEAEARLQMIEAAASRGQTFAETQIALDRLNAARDQLPLALETARLEHQLREDVTSSMRRGELPPTTVKAEDEGEGLKAEG